METFTKTTNRFVQVTSNNVSPVGSHAVGVLDHVVKLTRSRVGSANPRWATLVANGENATTPLTAYEELYVADSGLTRVRFVDGKEGSIRNSGYVSAYVPLRNVPRVAIREAAEAQAISALNGKIRKLQTPFEGAVFTGELRETIQLLRHPFGSMVKLTDAFYAKAKKNLKVTKASAGMWLEWQMAIMPLLSDTVQIIDLINNVARKEDKRALRVYGSSDSQTINTVVSSSMGCTGLIGTLERRQTVKVENVIRCGLLAAFIDGLEYNKSWLEDSFDDLSSIPITLYELTMYSFLVDYFVNVGDIIEGAVSSRSMLSFASNSVITTTTETRILNGCMINRPDLIKSLTLFSPTTITSTLREVTRSAAVSAIPPMVFTLPGTKIRYANIAALIASKGIK